MGKRRGEREGSKEEGTQGGREEGRKEGREEGERGEWRGEMEGWEERGERWEGGRKGREGNRGEMGGWEEGGEEGRGEMGGKGARGDVLEVMKTDGCTSRRTVVTRTWGTLVIHTPLKWEGTVDILLNTGLSKSLVVFYRNNKCVAGVWLQICDLEGEEGSRTLTM